MSTPIGKMNRVKLMEDMYDRAQVLTGGKLVVVLFAMEVAI